MAEVVSPTCNGVAWGIKELTRQYQEGKIRGMMVQLVQPDGWFVTMRCGEKATWRS